MQTRFFTLLLCLAFGLSLAGEVHAGATEAPIRIGVLAYRGPEAALREWQGHADYLSARIPARRFVVLPMGYNELESAVGEHSIDLLITNTGHYTELEMSGEVSRIATRLVAGPDGPLNQFGGVAITQAGRTDLQHYRDLRRQRILIPDQSSLGGWQVHLREALDQKLDLEHAAGEIIETGNHEKVIERLLAGEADAGFVRSDLIESMLATGKLREGQIRLIDPRRTPSYPYLHTTRLYPEWPLARVGDFPEALAKEVLIALLAMPPEAPAAKAAHIAGWTLPQNYQSVNDLFREAHLGPYANQEISWEDIMRRHGANLLLMTGSLAGILLFGIVLIARSNRRLHESEEELRLAAGVFRHAEEGILITDARGRIVDANDSASRLTGYPHARLIGATPRLLRSGHHPPEFYEGLWQTLLATGIWQGELHNQRADGSHYIQQTSISSIRNPDGVTTHYIGMFSDITALKESQQQLEHLAYYDALTGLPNRLLLADRMHLAIAHAERRKHRFAVCYLDLDNFKPINDRWGHQAGDQLLIEVGRRLSSVLRQEDTVCRLGGDEFVILINELHSISECEQALARIDAILDMPFPLHGEVTRISASIGVTLYPDDSIDADTLLRHADHAMYVAKQEGRHRYQFFHRRDEQGNAEYRRELQALRQALDERQFILYFQPKVDMHSGRVIGAEALIRWQHPTRGLLLPEDFLPMIEQTGLHPELGEYVISTALARMAQWATEGLSLPVSVNIDAQHLQRPDFAHRLRNLLLGYPNLPPHLLELEIVETAALQDLAQISERIQQCRGFGVQFAIDDFGTGYSSLSYLKQLPMQTLKIDLSFVRGMLDNPDDLAIVDGVIGLAAAFRRRVIAEGVESVAHGTMLLRLGCELGQGNVIAAAMPAADLVPWIRTWQAPAEWLGTASWSSADLPLLAVEVDHLRWISQFEAALFAGPEAPSTLPPLDTHVCRFGEWLNGDGEARYGHLPEFRQIVPLHDEVHQCARDLLAEHANDPEAARRRIDLLYQRRDALLNGLRQLHEMVNSGLALG